MTSSQATHTAAHTQRFADKLWVVHTLTKREIAGRLRGSVLGSLWLVVMPLLMLGLYTLVFNLIFKARMGITGSNTPFEYAYGLTCGLLFFNFASEIISKSPTLITSNPNFVKKVIFPLPVLAWVTVSSAMLTVVIHFCLLLILGTITSQIGLWQLLLGPVIILTAVPMMLGVCLLLSAVGVYIKDLAQITAPILSILLFTSPIFYPREALPMQFEALLAVNPISTPIQALRTVYVEHQMPDWAALGIYLVAGLALFAVGNWVFTRLKRGFADVI